MMLADKPDNDLQQITTLLLQYFDGLHRADVALLNTIFADEARLSAPGVRRSKSQWLELVANRPVPAQLGHAFAYQILSVDLSGEQAMAKVFCPLLGKQYLDYLGLLKEQGRWRIVAKQYADIPTINTNDPVTGHN